MDVFPHNNFINFAGSDSGSGSKIPKIKIKFGDRIPKGLFQQ
jgi:hypothetical protein